MKFIHEKIEIGYDDLKVETKSSGRKYITPDGEAYPSITTVLGVLSADSIAAWRARVGDEEANKISHKATTRGTAVHDLVEKYLDNEELPKVMPHVMASLANLKPSPVVLVRSLRKKHRYIVSILVLLVV